MKKIHEKIMRTDFAKSLKKLIIFVVCVVLLGGVSVAMLVPQIGEAVSGIRQWEQDGEENRGDGEQDEENRGDEEQNRKEFRENGEGDKELNDREGKEGDGREECDFLKNVTISPPMVGAVITLGITVLCGFLSLFLFWLLVTAWLYQAAVRSGMNGLFWLAAGIAGNVFGAIVFLLVRSFIRVRCPSCGAFLPVKTQYCSGCGAAMYEKCTVCGEDCAVGDNFCCACGKKLHENRD